MSGQLAILRGSGKLKQSIIRQVRKILDGDLGWVHHEVLRDDITGESPPPEWVGNMYAHNLFEIVGDRTDCIFLTFSGYDDDPREIFQIEEIQRFCAGFLGRICVAQGENITKMIDHFSRLQIGAWEGRMLSVLQNEDPTSPNEPSPPGTRRSGSRIRVLGCAEQLSEKPLVKWVKDGPGWLCEVEGDPLGYALSRCQGSIKGWDLPGRWGAGKLRWS